MIQLVNIHTHSATGNGIELVNTDNPEAATESNFKSAGLHPWKIGKCDHQQTIESIENWCRNGQIAAIGETGIDRAISTSISLQMNIFELQLDIAKRYHMPLIIHCVRAYSDFLQFMKNDTATTFIFHGFNGNNHTADQLLTHGAMLSFGENLLKSSKLQDVFKTIPNDCIFLETDTKEMNISDIYNFAATLRNVSIDELKQTIFNNLTRIFGNRWTTIG